MKYIDTNSENVKWSDRRGPEWGGNLSEIPTRGNRLREGASMDSRR